MPSKPTMRSQTHGFTLLEAMLSFAILGMVLASIYALSIRSFRQESLAFENFQKTAFARAILQEYILTYPNMPKYGVYKETWRWKIVETSEPVMVPTAYDRYFQFIRISAEVNGDGSSAAPIERSTVIARRPAAP